MTVAEVMAELAKLPPDAIVMDQGSQYNIAVSEVSYDEASNYVWIW